MKRLTIIITMVFLLFGCGKSTLIDDISTIKTISLYTNGNKYYLNKDKYEEFVNALNTYKYKEYVKEIDTTWKIEVELEDNVEIYYLNPDGSIIDNNQRLYASSEINISNIYKKALGKNIFQGEIIESGDWISNFGMLKRMFSFNINKIDEINVNVNSKTYYVKNEEISSIIDVLNESNYVSYEDGLTYGYINSFINIISSEEIYKINVYSSEDVYVARVIVDKDKDGVVTQERTYYLNKDSKLVQFYNEIIKNINEN